MAELISSVSLQVAADSRQVLGAIGRVSAAARAVRTPDGELPEALAAARTTGPVVLDVKRARDAVDRVLTAGFAILDALQGLEGNVRLAVSNGLTSPSTNLNLGAGFSVTGTGTRLSRFNISTALGRAVDAIDGLVAASATGQANLISSTGRRVSIQTSEFGGRITVEPQPLDAAGLDLEGLSTLTRLDAEEALARIRTATNTTATRLDNLEALQRTLGFAGGFAQSFNRVANDGFEQPLPRGSFVNLVA